MRILWNYSVSREMKTLIYLLVGSVFIQVFLTELTANVEFVVMCGGLYPTESTRSLQIVVCLHQKVKVQV